MNTIVVYLLAEPAIERSRFDYLCIYCYFIFILIFCLDCILQRMPKARECFNGFVTSEPECSFLSSACDAPCLKCNLSVIEGMTYL